MRRLINKHRKIIIKKWKGKIKGGKRMAVSMGTLPYLNKEQAKILLSDMQESTLKKDMFDGCGKKLKEIVEKYGL